MANSAQKVSVSLVYAEREKQWLFETELSRGSDVYDLLNASQFLENIPALQGKLPENLEFAVYADPTRGDTMLEEGDRIAIIRPLTADPKEVRRQMALLGKSMVKRD
ncbi:MAG: RnfH family protein [Pseudomonadota bacterium]